MRLALVLLVSSLCVSAHAQSGSSVTSVRGSLSLHGRVESSGETSCSQSFATSHDTIELALDVTVRGDATLTAESLSQRTFGDASTRYTTGQGTLTQTLSRRTLTGQATRSPSGIDIRFTHAEDVMMRWQGPGVGTLPSTTTPTTVALSMHCTLADVPVLPAVEAASETAAPLPLLRCTFDAAPTFIEYDETNDFLFGRGHGARVVSRHGGWDPLPSTVFRLAE